MVRILRPDGHNPIAGLGVGGTRQSSLEVLRPVLEKMVQHARREYPLECCGLLRGRPPRIEQVVAVHNLRESQYEFFASPEALFRFFKSLRGTEDRLMGIYHSHPQSAAVPSQRDLEECFYPEASYWIVSLQNETPDIRSFRWVKMGFEEIGYRVIEE